MTFNKPYLSGREMEYIADAVQSGHISGNGKYTKLCHQFFKNQYGFNHCLLTTSCTDALEMASILLNIQPGDEVIMPSYTFVSTANAFVLRGAKIVFCDSRADHPGIDELLIENLITAKTKAIVVVHYAGVACDMDVVMDIAHRNNLLVIEDAAQAIDSYYRGKDGVRRPLGSIGHLGTFSFHETKNIIAGEGGLLVINDEQFVERAEILWEKGTNRSAFFRGEVNKYGWVDVGSSFLPSELIAAFLLAQLEAIDRIQSRRKNIWERYHNSLCVLKDKGKLALPNIPVFATNNAHMYYIVCENLEQRSALLNHLKTSGVYAVFHYLSLHKSDFYRDNYNGGDLLLSDNYSDCLVRLPMYFELRDEEIDLVNKCILDFFSI